MNEIREIEEKKKHVNEIREIEEKIKDVNEIIRIKKDGKKGVRYERQRRNRRKM